MSPAAHQPLMPNGGSIITLTYGGSNRVTPFYNVMGVAKAALESPSAIWPMILARRHPRQRDQPGPMKTLAGAAIGGARKTFRHTEANAPLRANATLERSAARPSGCVRTMGRLHHRRDRPRRWRLSRPGHAAARKPEAARRRTSVRRTEGTSTA
jgi:hypothetical protein